MEAVSDQENFQSGTTRQEFMTREGTYWLPMAVVSLIENSLILVRGRFYFESKKNNGQDFYYHKGNQIGNRWKFENKARL